MTNNVANAKYIQPKGAPLTEGFLQGAYPELRYLGTIQKTGIIGIHNATQDIVVVVRHPRWVLSTASAETASFGGEQTTDLVRAILGRSFRDKAPDVARAVLSALKANTQPPYHTLLIGKEVESVAVSMDGEISELPKSEQIEFQRAVHEDALPPVKSVAQASLLRAEQVLARANHHKSLLMMDTSAPLAGRPSNQGMQLNNGRTKGYIRPWAEHLSRHLCFTDRDARGVLTQVARRYGYSSYRNMLAMEGFQVGWPSVACQTNYGLPHISQPNGEYAVPLEVAIAVADVFNSTIGAVADILMCSSPLLYGFTPTVKSGTVKDYRMVLRYIFDGAASSPFIHDTRVLKKRWADGMLNGVLFTIDRLSYQAKRPGRAPHAIIYGAARIRLETDNLAVQSGRVESTIAGNSPSLFDEIAHDAFLYLLYVAALEAVEAGLHPKDFFRKKVPLVSDWRKRRYITQLYNCYGSNAPEVKELVKQAVDLLDHLSGHYPNLGDMVLFTKARIQNLMEKGVDDLAKYARSAEGPISDVMLNMYKNGTPPAGLCQQVCEYQKLVAGKIRRLSVDAFFKELSKLC